MLERGMTATAPLLVMAAVGLLSLMAREAECLELPSRRNNVGGGVGGKVRKGTHEHRTLPRRFIPRRDRELFWRRRVSSWEREGEDDAGESVEQRRVDYAGVSDARSSHTPQMQIRTKEQCLLLALMIVLLRNYT